MAQFLNDPARIGILNSKFSVTTEPLLFQYAGTPVPKELVSDYLQKWSQPGAYEAFRNKLPADVQIWLVPPGKMTDGPSMPGYVACAGIMAILAWLTSLFGYYAPDAAGLIGGFLGALVRAYMKPEDFYLAGMLHDDLRVKLSTGNATTDGFLRDAVTAEAAWVVRSYIVYLGVRAGTLFGYKTKVKEELKKEALKRYARIRGVEESDLWFDDEHSEIRYTIKDPIQSIL